MRSSIPLARLSIGTPSRFKIFAAFIRVHFGKKRFRFLSSADMEPSAFEILDKIGSLPINQIFTIPALAFHPFPSLQSAKIFGTSGSTIRWNDLSCGDSYFRGVARNCIGSRANLLLNFSSNKIGYSWNSETLFRAFCGKLGVSQAMAAPIPKVYLSPRFAENYVRFPPNSPIMNDFLRLYSLSVFIGSSILWWGFMESIASTGSGSRQA